MKGDFLKEVRTMFVGSYINTRSKQRVSVYLQLDTAMMFDNGNEYEWTLIEKTKRGFKQIGQFAVGVFKRAPCVMYAYIDENRQSRGIGTKTYKRLAKFYGALESDPNGSTSDLARKVWARLGAKELKRGRYRLEVK